MTQTIKTPDGDIEVSTPLEAYWQKVVDAREIDIKNLEESLVYQKAVLEMAKHKVKENAK